MTTDLFFKVQSTAILVGNNDEIIDSQGAEHSNICRINDEIFDSEGAEHRNTCRK